MFALRYITVACTCLALALPLPAFPLCCCVKGNAAQKCCCSAPVMASHCCCKSSTEKDGSEVAFHSGERSCECLVRASTNAIVAPNSKFHVDIGIASWSPALFATTPILFSILLSSLDRPPIGHNRRLAALGVWRK